MTRGSYFPTLGLFMCVAGRASCRISVSQILAATTIAIVLSQTAAAVTLADLTTYREWGVGVAESIEVELARSDSKLYAEAVNLNGNQFGGVNGYAFIWAASVQMRALNSMVEIAPSRANRNALYQFSDDLHQRYWLNSNDGQNGYVVAPGSTERYYDDNAHMTVALMEAYELTKVQRLLDRAIATHDFVLEGEDNHQGGGIYFREGSFGNKNTISTLQEARGAAMIYQATGEQRFLDDANRLLEWANDHVQRSDGLYYQDARDNITDIGNVPLTNGAGMGILTNLEMYDITRDEAYLQEAQRIGARSANNFRNSSDGHVWGGGYWAFELVDAWVDLYQHDGRTRWLSYAAGVVEFLEDSIQDNNGHYGRDWHTASDSSWPELDDWLLIDQASVARAYLYTSLAEPPAVPGDYNDDGIVDAADYAVWRNNLDASAGTLPNDINGGTIGQEQYLTWRQNFGKKRATLTPGNLPSTTTNAPEPSGFVLLFAGIVVRSRAR